MFVPPGRGEDAYHVKLIDKHILSAGKVANWLIEDAADKAGVTNVSKRTCSGDVDCDHVAGGRNTEASIFTYTRDLTAGGDISPSLVTHSRVVLTGGIAIERVITEG